jgi:RimJ/RimL family protein N-acetyltransferase
MYEIETDRLKMRPYVAADIDILAAMYDDPQVTAATKLGQRSRDESTAVLDGYLLTWHENSFGMRAAFEKATGAYVGECGLFISERSNSIALRYALLPQYWGMGYAGEAVAATLADAFMRSMIECLNSTAQTTNAASLGVMEKAGMRRVKTERRGSVTLSIYELTRDEWLAANPEAAPDAPPDAAPDR